jgi:hypothetical protein
MGLAEDPNHGSGICASAGKGMLTKSAAKSMAKRCGRQTGRNIQAYNCRACGYWHVGTLRRWPQERKTCRN